MEFLPLLRASNGLQTPAASSEMSLSPVVTAWAAEQDRVSGCLEVVGTGVPYLRKG